MRRKKAAEIRARPGASRKGVPKKVPDGEKVRVQTHGHHSNGDNPAEAVESGETNCSGGGWKEQLADMRWVYSHPMSQDKTQGHRICRQWLRDKKAEFMSYKSRLEEKVLVIAGEEKEEEEKQKEENRNPLLDELMDEWSTSLKAQEDEENAELAAGRSRLLPAQRIMADISAEWLLAHLDYLGFCLEIKGKKLRVFPANKLTDFYRKAIKEHKRELFVLVLDRVPLPTPAKTPGQKAGKQPAKVEPFVCPICEQPRPGDPDCPRCKLERDWVERKSLPASGVDQAPGSLRSDDLPLPEQMHVPVFPKLPDGEW
jgi:hypothetical protein